MEFDNENHSQQRIILNGTSFAASSFGTIFASRDVHLTCHSICTLDFNGVDSHLHSWLNVLMRMRSNRGVIFSPQITR
jgi:hypothetical protein